MSYDKDTLRPLGGDKYEHVIPHPNDDYIDVDNYIDETIECTNCSHPKFDHMFGQSLPECLRCDCKEFANEEPA